MLRVDTERRFSLDPARDGELVEPLPRFKNRGLAPSNVSIILSKNIEGSDRNVPRPAYGRIAGIPAYSGQGRGVSFRVNIDSLTSLNQLYIIL